MIHGLQSRGGGGSSVGGGGSSTGGAPAAAGIAIVGSSTGVSTRVGSSWVPLSDIGSTVFEDG